MALTFFPSPSWLHKAFFSPQSLLPPVWELLGKWKELTTEEEAEIQLMVPNSGRDVSGWKNQPGRAHLHPYLSEATGRLQENSV